MTTFKKYIDKLDTLRKKSVEEYIQLTTQELKDAGIFQNNFYNDIFLNENSREFLVDSIHENLNEFKHSLNTSILSNLFRSSLKLKGNNIQIDCKLIGCSIKEEDLYYCLTTELENFEKFGYSEYQVKNFLSDLQYNRKVDNKYNNVLIKPSYYIVWVTFNENGENNPFKFCDFNKEYMISSLGLGHYDINDKVYRLIFNSSSINKDITRPTIADAGYYTYFRPTEKELKYGLTEPICTYVPGKKECCLKRPEGVVSSSVLRIKDLINSDKL